MTKTKTVPFQNLFRYIRLWRMTIFYAFFLASGPCFFSLFLQIWSKNASNWEKDAGFRAFNAFMRPYIDFFVLFWAFYGLFDHFFLPFLSFFGVCFGQQKRGIRYKAVSRLFCQRSFMPYLHNNLTDGIFETGAYGVPSKSQSPIVLGQGGLSSTQCSNTSWACSWHQQLPSISTQ